MFREEANLSVMRSALVNSNAVLRGQNLLGLISLVGGLMMTGIRTRLASRRAQVPGPRLCRAVDGAQ